MSQVLLEDLVKGVTDGKIVPYLGPYALEGCVEVGGDMPIPADSDSLIYALNGGKPMAPRLMYEFPRAAMNLELKKGRTFLERFFAELYGQRQWTRNALHNWLAEVKPPYVIDINRDLHLQDSYAKVPHALVRGISRVAGTDYRFEIHAYDGESYKEIGIEDMDISLPILFKPMGSPRPTNTYIASDADYVDYITELMGGFAIPAPMKPYRTGKQYLLMGLRLTRDTERMVLSDIIYGAGKPAGWALLPNANPKEKRFLAKIGIEVVDASVDDFLKAAGALNAEIA